MNELDLVWVAMLPVFIFGIFIFIGLIVLFVWVITKPKKK